MDKAVILAGGYGTRLAPITQTLPKPLVPVLEKSVLEHILDNLQNLGIREVVMSTMYLREKIIDKIGNRYKDINIGYENEEIPIGTAGGAKTAALKLNLREDENFLIVSGDGIFDFDLRGAVSFHESKSALATIVTYSHPKPLDYGIILSDKDGRIKRFIEKPNWSQVITDTINTGIYILNKKSLDFIPDNTNFDFSKDLFQKLLSENQKLYSCNCDGYWCDIGNISEYKKCQFDALDNKISGIKVYNNYQSKNVTIIPPCYVADGCDLGENCVIGPYACVYENCRISEGSVIEKSIIFANSVIGRECIVSDSIISENCLIGNNCAIENNAVIGSDCEIFPKSILKNVSVDSCSKIRKEPKNENIGKVSRFYDGYYLFSKEDFSYFSCMKQLNKIKNFICSKKSGASVFIMNDGSKTGEMCTEIFISILRSCNINIIYAGKGFSSQCSLLSVIYESDFSVFFDEYENICKIIVCDSKTSDITESAINYGVNTKDLHTFSFSSKNGKLYSISDGKLLYKAKLKKSFDYSENEKSISDIKCALTSDEKNSGKKALVEEILRMHGAEIVSYESAAERTLPIIRFYDNDNISINHGNYTFDRYHLEALVLLYQKNKKIFFDKTVPDVYKKICKINDNEIIFDFKKITKHEILENFWTKDVCHLALKTISILDKTKSSLAEYYFLLPQFCVCEKISHFNKEEKIASTVKTLIEKSSKINFNDKNDGVEIIYPHGRVRVIPKPDLGFKIISESEKYEISEELCNKVMDIIK